MTHSLHLHPAAMHAVAAPGPREAVHDIWGAWRTLLRRLVSLPHAPLTHTLVYVFRLCSLVHLALFTPSAVHSMGTTYI